CTVAFSPEGKTLASGSHDRTVRLWDVATGKELLPFEGHRSIVRSLAFMPDGKTLVSNGWDGKRASRKPLPPPPPRSGEGEQPLSFSPSPLRGGGGGRGC